MLENPIAYVNRPLHLVGGKPHLVEARMEYITPALAEVVHEELVLISQPLGGGVVQHEVEDEEGDTLLKFRFPTKSRAEQFLATVQVRYPAIRVYRH